MNDEMSMKRRVGTKGKPIVERMLNVFDLHFPTPAVEAMSRILRFQNQEKFANIWLVLAIQTVMPVGYTILLLSAKQSRENQCNEASRLKKMYQKSSALSIRFEMRRSPFAIEFTTFAAKKPQPLCETGTKRGLEKQGKCSHRLIMHSITRRGET